ncbi:type III secretion system export apparatus subunit SctT [Rhodoferax sp. TBRC 17660]|jgi:type III secretion protein T|uniref:Type III secretion system export apparatus subunit SctT n=1 Tax=Rhodoferax potami TaxID=3068338 RepID=A0ABU3KSK1_9BURK|nr:type III secretion system export apparatus subunit SctT [Rhodoferax sp. TBRC 17660]MDT7520744.1 type III secretion system export apparatus subunit SctT [Rhodoferax sp. TBRC 17660]
MLGMQEVQGAVLGLMLGMARLVALLSLLPYYSKQASSALMRVAIAMAFTFPALPMLMSQYSQNISADTLFLGLFFKEVFIGLCIGWAIALPFWAAEAIGFIISNQYGATVGNSTDAITGNETSPLGVILLQLYLVLFLLHGGANAVLDTYYASYTVWPLAATWPTLDAGFPEHWLKLFDAMMRLSVMLAAPAMIAMLLAEIGLAIVSMFAPQLPVFFLAMPVKACIALFVLTLYLATLMGYLGDHARAMAVILPDLGRLAR